MDKQNFLTYKESLELSNDWIPVSVSQCDPQNSLQTRIDWCKQYLKNHWTLEADTECKTGSKHFSITVRVNNQFPDGYLTFFFQTKEDALLFKLTWG